MKRYPIYCTGRVKAILPKLMDSSNIMSIKIQKEKSFFVDRFILKFVYKGTSPRKIRHL